MFTHLHVHTGYSILDGHSRIDKLVNKAKEMGQSALAITDHGYMYGVIPFYNACTKNGIKPILGVELYTTEDITYKSSENRHAGHIVLLAKDQQGYINLLKLESIAATDGMYYRPRVDLSLLQKYHEGIVCLSGCIQGDVPQLLLKGEKDKAYELAKKYHEIFGDDYYIELQYHGLTDQKAALPMLIALARDLKIQMVATNDVHYVNKEDAESQRTLMVMNMKTTIDDETAVGYGNPDHWYMKSEEEMHAIFYAFAPEAIQNTQVIADKCNVTLKQGEYHLPKFPLPDGVTSNTVFFRALCKAGLEKRYKGSADQHLAQLEYEMNVIETMGFIDYFLIVSDIITYAKRHGIPIGPGRGSSAGSIVAYCMGITDIEPSRFSLVFERFLNPERITMPDVDIDVSPEGREEVIAHIIDMYGADHVARIIAFSELAAKGAVRDVGKAICAAPTLINNISKRIPAGPGITLRDLLDHDHTLKKMYEDDPEAKRLLDISMSVEGLVRHTTTHAAGIVISPEPVTNLIPVQKDRNGHVISQFDMASLEAVGMLKVDLLGLKTLEVLDHAQKLTNELHTELTTPLDLTKLKLSSQDVYAMLSKGQTAGVFQLESTGMRDTLKKLQPTCIEDLAAVIALYRPGPMDSIPKFIENKNNKDQIQYLIPQLEPILKDTYGTIVYQEQVMAIVREVAGYSFGRADLVRRAMSKKKHDVMEHEKDVFINGSLNADGSVDVEGCVRRGIPAEIGEQIWAEMADFASYAFNRAHAACYAVMAYRTAFMRCYYPHEFFSALLTNSIDDKTEKMVGYINDVTNMGIKVLPPDINTSEVSFSVEGDSIRYGLLAIKNTGITILSEIVEERKIHGPYTDLQDLVERNINSVKSNTLEALINSGSFDSFPHSREEMLAILPAITKAAAKARKKMAKDQMALDSSFFAGMSDDPAFHFPRVEYPTDVTPMTMLEKLKMEQAATGMFISGHPLDSFAEEIKLRADTPIAKISETDDGNQIRVAGVVTAVRKITTRKKSRMAFVTIEDKTSNTDVTVFPKAFEAHGDQLTEGAVVIVFGKVEDGKLIADGISFMSDADAAEN